MRLVNDPTDPDTMPERNRRAYAAWLFNRAMGAAPPDPLTCYERAAADYDLAIKRVRIRNWWRLEGRWRQWNATDKPAPLLLGPDRVVPFRRVKT